MSHSAKFPWFRRALAAVAFAGIGTLALGAATPAQAYWYYPYYGYPYYYPYYSAYYPYYYGYPYYYSYPYYGYPAYSYPGYRPDYGYQ